MISYYTTSMTYKDQTQNGIFPSRIKVEKKEVGLSGLRTDFNNITNVSNLLDVTLTKASSLTLIFISSQRK